MFANCTKEQFGKCTNEERRAFIHAREFVSHTIPKSSNWKWPTKQGLIDLAYERRLLPIVLKLPSEDTNNQPPEMIPVVEPTVLE